MLCTTHNSCHCFCTIITGLLIGSCIGLAYRLSLIATILPFIYASLALGIIVLLFILFSYFCKSAQLNRFCLCKTCLISLIVGLIFSSIIALTISALPTGSFSIAILIGTIGFFFVETLLNVLFLISCLKIRNKDYCD